MSIARLLWSSVESFQLIKTLLVLSRHHRGGSMSKETFLIGVFGHCHSVLEGKGTSKWIRASLCYTALVLVNSPRITNADVHVSFKLYWQIQQPFKIYLLWRVNLDFNDFSFFQSPTHFVLTYSFLSFWLFSRSFFCPLFHPLLKIMIYISLIAGKSSALFLFVLLHSTHCSVLLHCPCSVISSKLFSTLFLVFCSLTVTMKLWHVQVPSQVL